MKIINFILPFWYPVYIKQGFTTYPIKIDFFSENYVGYKKNDEIIVHTDVCPHNGASLAKGWINKNGNLQCPYHGFEFCHGVFHKIPNPSCNSSHTINGFKMNVYDTKEDKKIIFMKNSNTVPDIFYPPEEYNSNLLYVEGSCKFDANYKMVMENLLDMLHISYVHSFGSVKTPLPQIKKFEYLNEYHGRTTFEYEPNENSLGKKLGKVKKVFVENEFILPTSTITRVKAGDTLKTVFTRAIPISNKQTVLYWKIYRNFWKHRFSDMIVRNLMEKTLEEDMAILKNCYTNHNPTIKTKYDVTIHNFRKTLKNYENKYNYENKN